MSEELSKLLVADVDARVRDIFLALDHARNGAERIRDIVRSLKTFSRSESETSIALDVRQVLDAAVDMVEAEIRHRASLIKEYAVVPTVRANEARLGQVFLNLLLNAVQALVTPGAMAKGNGTMAVYVDKRANPEQHAALEAIFTGQAGGPPALMNGIIATWFPTVTTDIDFSSDGKV